MTEPLKCLGVPELYSGAPVGMYHCDSCGEMVVAGMPAQGHLELTEEQKNLVLEYWTDGPGKEALLRAREKENTS